MPIKYNGDILQKLKDAGYNTNKLRHPGPDAPPLISESALQYIRDGKPVGIVQLEKICDLLQCQPGEIYIAVDATGKPYPEKKKPRTRRQTHDTPPGPPERQKQ